MSYGQVCGEGKVASAWNTEVLIRPAAAGFNRPAGMKSTSGKIPETAVGQFFGQRIKRSLESMSKPLEVLAS
jgi:hypothetical protein